MSSIVVADAGPLHYLVLIDCGEILGNLFDHVLVPFAVRDELLHPRARPGKLVGIGLNYPTTNREVALDTPAAAVTLAKFASTVGAAVVSGTRP